LCAWFTDARRVIDMYSISREKGRESEKERERERER
jgi:hypothetical protein